MEKVFNMIASNASNGEAIASDVSSTATCVEKKYENSMQIVYTLIYGQSFHLPFTRESWDTSGGIHFVQPFFMTQLAVTDWKRANYGQSSIKYSGYAVLAFRQCLVHINLYSGWSFYLCTKVLFNFVPCGNNSKNVPTQNKITLSVMKFHVSC